MAKFPIGTKVKVKGKNIGGIVEAAFMWNNPNGYQGMVYNFRDGYNRININYKEADLEAAE
jgi:hypothetical protein